ncbi:MAG: class I SAM-dependent methyltransferase [Woeseiaceae bacterium]
MAVATPEPGSFRDNKGRIYYVGDRVFRTITPAGIADFEAVRATGLVDELVGAGLLIAENRVDVKLLGESAADASLVIEHPRLPYISYPYEWSFEALKTAALAHLELHQKALRKNVTLSDATAFNVQFRGAKPVFIDSLSLRMYDEGEFWAGHRQFCEQFINPLLLRSVLGVPHNAWYRGAIEGISAQELGNILPWRSRFSWNILTHVFLQARLQRASGSAQKAAQQAGTRKLAKIGFEQILHGLQRWISKLEPRKSGATVWQNYSSDNSYVDIETERKRDFVQKFIENAAPELVFDIGCNTGDYSILALEHGARRAVGFDFDHGALDHAFRRARELDVDFLPLHLDAANPSPSQGWMQKERQGLLQRARGDAVLALAVVHHLAISKNLPLPEVLGWIIDIAPQGVIEFVPKQDPMVQRLLSLREDIFASYDEESFREAIGAGARIVNSSIVSSSGRTLYWYDRR